MKVSVIEQPGGRTVVLTIESPRGIFQTAVIADIGRAAAADLNAANKAREILNKLRGGTLLATRALEDLSKLFASTPPACALCGAEEPLTDKEGVFGSIPNVCLDAKACQGRAMAGKLLASNAAAEVRDAEPPVAKLTRRPSPDPFSGLHPDVRAAMAEEPSLALGDAPSNLILLSSRVRVRKLVAGTDAVSWLRMHNPEEQFERRKMGSIGTVVATASAMPGTCAWLVEQDREPYAKGRTLAVYLNEELSTNA